MFDFFNRLLNTDLGVIKVYLIARVECRKRFSFHRLLDKGVRKWYSESMSIENRITLFDMDKYARKGVGRHCGCITKVKHSTYG